MGSARQVQTGHLDFVMHSKLETRRWPNPEELTRRLRTIALRSAAGEDVPSFLAFSALARHRFALGFWGGRRHKEAEAHQLLNSTHSSFVRLNSIRRTLRMTFDPLQPETTSSVHVRLARSRC